MTQKKVNKLRESLEKYNFRIFPFLKFLLKIFILIFNEF